MLSLRLVTRSALIFLIQWIFVHSAFCSVRGKNGMVVSGHRLASHAGVEIMRAGGNAIDAAVAAGFALAVVFPEAGNIGGGGFMLVRFANGNSTCIDFREIAPLKSYRDMFLDESGDVTDKSLHGHMSVAVPGTVAGLLYALENYGRLKRADVIQPAVDLAERGFEVDKRLESSLAEYSEHLRIHKTTSRIFFKNGELLKEGDTLFQPDLAATLRRIQRDGADGFYKGETARYIVDEMKRGGGLLTFEDLGRYRALERKTISCEYRGYRIITIPLPSSGGTCLIEMLNIVEGYDLKGMGFHSSNSVHIMAEAMKRVYADRAEYLGDPDFIGSSADFILTKEYAALRRSGIDMAEATPSSAVRCGKPGTGEGENTTHYVAADKSGNVVSVTYTLNDLFGSKVIVGGAGFFLNDEMDDFTSKPGVPNVYGLTGGSANTIEPGKKPLSSMAPVIVTKNNKTVMSLGGRGGSRIITGVFQAIVNTIDYGMSVSQAVESPRFHHQLLPDTLFSEKYCLSAEVLTALRMKGHTVEEGPAKVSKLEALSFDLSDSVYIGAPDPREGGTAIGY